MYTEILIADVQTFEPAIDWTAIIPEAKLEDVKDLTWWQICEKYSPDNPKIIEDKLLNFMEKSLGREVRVNRKDRFTRVYKIG